MRTTTIGKPAVFLDRDGVLVVDRGPLTRACDIEPMPGAPEGLRQLKRWGYLLLCVSNQAVVARGLCSEWDVLRLQECVSSRLRDLGAPELDAFDFCPHHPHANDEAYRRRCECRKPEPGLLLRAARRLGVDLGRSFMLGDRLSDVAAGQRAGCRSILLRSGRHLDPPIVAPAYPKPIVPDHACDDWPAVLNWIARETVHPPGMGYGVSV